MNTSPGRAGNGDATSFTCGLFERNSEGKLILTSTNGHSLVNLVSNADTDADYRASPVHSDAMGACALKHALEPGDNALKSAKRYAGTSNHISFHAYPQEKVIEIDASKDEDGEVGYKEEIPVEVREMTRTQFRLNGDYVRDVLASCEGDAEMILRGDYDEMQPIEFSDPKNPQHTL